MVPNTPVAATDPNITARIFPNKSQAQEKAWLDVSDDYLILFELLENVALFSTSKQYKYEGITKPGAEWERLVICQNKQDSGFRFIELETMLKHKSNCCRQVAI